MKRAALPCFVLVVVLASTGCTNTPRDAIEAVVRDSAGIRVVENTVPRLGQDAWSIDTAPRLEVGNGTGGQELFRVVGALRRADGGLLVANGGSSELRLFDAAGQHERSVGGRGSGPGEFMVLGGIRPYRGDSLLAYDTRLRRLTVFDRDANFGRLVTSASGETVAMQPQGTLDDGKLVAIRMAPLDGNMDGVVRRAETLHLLSPDGAVHDTLATFRGQEMFANRGGGDLLLITIPFSRGTSYATSGSTIYAGTNDTYEIVALEPGRGVTMMTRRTVAPQPATAAEGAALVDSLLSQLPNPAVRERRRRALEGVPVAEFKPLFDGIMTDRLGLIWVRHFDPLAEHAPAFDVFSRDGTWEATVRFPRGFQPLDIGEDFVVGRWIDEMGVERVRTLGLHRG
jgi:hypothetical protein